MTIKVKLPRKMSGKELSDIIADSTGTMEEYNVQIYKDGHYELDEDIRKETKINYVLKKTEVKKEMIFKGNFKWLYMVPVFWMIYTVENLCSYKQNTRISTSFEPDKDHEELEFEVESYDGDSWPSAHSTDINMKNIQEFPEIQEDFEKLIKEMYSKL